MRAKSSTTVTWILLAASLGAAGCSRGATASRRALTVRPDAVGQAEEFPTPVPTPSASPTPDATPSPTPPPIAGTSTPMGARLSDCQTNPLCDACIFEKGPNSQNGAAVSAGLRYNSSLGYLQTYCVTLPEVATTSNPTGLLQSSSYRVVPSGVTRVAKSATNAWRVPYAGDTQRANAQIMMFYWLSRQNSFMKEQTGANAYTVGRSILADSNGGSGFNAYWSSSQNKIVMLSYAGTGAGLPSYGCAAGAGACSFAHDAGVFAHENAHAYLSLASNRAVDTGGCSTDLGGYNEGQADFAAAILFNSHTALGARATLLGENITNDNAGLSGRNVRNNAALKFSDVGTECHAAGRVVGSIWWQLYVNARGTAGHVPTEVVRLYHEHMADLAGGDSYETIAGIMIQNDQALFGGKYSAAIRAEWLFRGITAP